MSDERVSVLVGDRLCIRCGYNLTGQPVVREAHYRMLIVRCPECGTVASVQEYPLLGRWAARWAAALAAAWLVAALVLLLGTSGILAGTASQVGFSAAAPLITRVNQFQNERYQQLQKSGSTSFAAAQVTEEEVAAMVADGGGWRKVANTGAVYAWTWMGPLIFCIGCVMATFFVNLRPRWLVVAGLATALLAAAFIVIGRASDRAAYSGYDWGAAFHMARDQIGSPFMYGSIVLGFLCLTAGLLLGRPIARGLIRALLPPRLRSSLALLWIADGLAPPGRIKTNQVCFSEKNKPGLF